MGALETAGVTTIREQCGSQVPPLVTTLGAFRRSLLDLQALGARTLQLTQCDRINYLYTVAAYDAACRESIEGTTWGFGTLLVVGVCGLIMITLRASWIDDEDIYELNDIEEEDPADIFDDEDLHSENTMSNIEGYGSKSRRSQSNDSFSLRSSPRVSPTDEDYQGERRN